MSDGLRSRAPFKPTDEKRDYGLGFIACLRCGGFITWLEPYFEMRLAGVSTPGYESDAIVYVLCLPCYAAVRRNRKAETDRIRRKIEASMAES